MLQHPAIKLALVSLTLFVAACSPGGDEPAMSGEDIDAALQALGLVEGERVSWQSQTREGQSVRFEGFVLTGEDAMMAAEALVVEAPRIGDNGPDFESLSFSRAVITYEDGESRFEAFTLSDPGPDMVEAAASLFQGREAVETEGDASARRFGALSVSGLTVAMLTDEGRPLRFDLQALSVDGFDGSVFSSLQLEGMVLETFNEVDDAVSFSLERVVAEGVGTGPIEASATRPFSGGINIGEAYDRFAIEGLMLNTAGFKVDMASLRGDTEVRPDDRIAATIEMPELVLSADAASGDLGAQMSGALGQMGFETLRFSLQSTTVYDPEADRVQTEGVNALVLEEGFQISFQQDLSGVGAYAEAYSAWLQDNASADVSAVPSDILDLLVLNAFQLEFRDEAFLDSIFTAAAAQSGNSAEMMRSQAAMLMVFASAFASGVVDRDTISASQGALTGFITQGGTLIIGIEPETPLPMAAFNDGTPIGAEQGVSVTHSPPQ